MVYINNVKRYEQSDNCNCFQVQNLGLSELWKLPKISCFLIIGLRDGNVSQLSCNCEVANRQN